MRVAALSLLLCGLVSVDAGASTTIADAIARGEAAYARRAEGQRDGRASPEPIGEAIAAFEAALSSDPASLEARWKLLESLYFAGYFAVQEPDEKRRIYDRARIVSDEGVELLERRVGEKPHELDAEEMRERLTAAQLSTPDVARFYFWSAINWGAWSRVFGLLRAVRRGVANRLHEYSLVAIELEPTYFVGGPHRLLARLHAELPRVPLFSGWVDRSQAIPEAERALAVDPEDPGNRLLLALTLLDLGSERREEALAILKETVELEPRSNLLIEDLAMRRTAAKRLRAERGR
jgi:tetratricopeptide (TPR) repeat protein